MSDRLRKALEGIGTFKDGMYVAKGKKDSTKGGSLFNKAAMKIKSKSSTGSGRPLTAKVKKLEDTKFFMMKKKADTKAPAPVAMAPRPMAPVAMAPVAMAPRPPAMMAKKSDAPRKATMMASDKAVKGGYTISTAMKPEKMKKDTRPGTGVFPGSPEDKKKADKPKPKSKFRGAGTTGGGGRRSSSGTRKPKPKTNTTPTKSGPLKGSIKAINGKFHRWDGTKYVPLK